MAEAVVVDADPGLSGSGGAPLVSVSFQKNEQRKLKFLEGEPKLLGIAQIFMVTFHVSCVALLYGSGLSRSYVEIPEFISSIFVFIAGSVAIAAKNLHLPTLRACLGMEIVACVASIFNLIVTSIQISSHRYYCYYYDDTNGERQICINGNSAHEHLFAELMVIQVALFAISVTLAVYACKVVNCCAPKVPVITIQAAPPAPQ